MACNVDRLTQQRPVEALSGDAHRKMSEEHVADRHLVVHGIEPLDEQEFDVWRLATHLDRVPRFDFDVGDHCSQCAGSLLKRFFNGRAPPADSNIGVMGEVLPPGPAGGM
jgi:hypothetical protein